jgi:trehalose 6-phosphate phosphatase
MTIAKPDALDQWDDLRSRLDEAGVIVFLDYDGTLTPIVARPDQAVLTPEMRNTLRHLANRWPTAIVTGRSLEQIEQLVNVPGITYAGSHGFDIRGPGIRYQVGAQARDAINHAFAEIVQMIGGIEGVLVENKTFSVAVHFRLVPPGLKQKVIEATHEVARKHGLRVTGGKQVIEMRPDVDWDKGTAIRWLAERLPGRTPLFIGDDVTDEDAFRAIRGDGITILVSAEPRETAAEYSLRDVEAVHEFLRRLAEIPRRDAAARP